MSDLSNQIHFESTALWAFEDFDPEFDISVETILEQHFADLPAEDSDEYLYWLHIHLFQDAVNVVTTLTGNFEERKDALAWLLNLKFAHGAGSLIDELFEMKDMQKAIKQMRKLHKKAMKSAARS